MSDNFIFQCILGVDKDVDPVLKDNPTNPLALYVKVTFWFTQELYVYVHVGFLYLPTTLIDI